MDDSNRPPGIANDEKPPRSRWKILSLGGFIGLGFGIVIGSLKNAANIQTHGFGFFMGGVCFEAQFWLVIGALLGWAISWVRKR